MHGHLNVKYPYLNTNFTPNYAQRSRYIQNTQLFVYQIVTLNVFNTNTSTLTSPWLFFTLHQPKNLSTGRKWCLQPATLNCDHQLLSWFRIPDFVWNLLTPVRRNSIVQSANSLAGVARTYLHGCKRYAWTAVCIIMVCQSPRSAAVQYPVRK